MTPEQQSLLEKADRTCFLPLLNPPPFTPQPRNCAPETGFLP